MDITTQNGHADESMSPMVLLPPEIKTQILSYLGTQESLSYLSQSCRAWHEVANEELYKRDSRENNSLAIKWMADNAVDEQSTDSAIRTLEISRQWGGQIDAVKPHLSQSERVWSDNKDQIYDTSTALHFAVSIGNMRLTKTLLDMKASLEIPISSLSSLIRESELPDGSSGPFERVRYFTDVIPGYHLEWCPMFPIFIAFLRKDRDMCKLLIEHGAGREATLVNTTTGAVAISILHFAAADRTMCYRQWRCLFDKFREYVDEPFPPTSIDPFGLRPLHIALKVGCTQGMEMAVEYGADKEARDCLSPTPMFIGFLEIISEKHADRRPWRKRTMCFRKFVELGASVNAVSEGESVLVLAVEHYVHHCLPARNRESRDMRGLISFLLEQHADIHGTSGNSWSKTNVVSEIIWGITVRDHDQSLKELLSDLLDRGLNLTTPAPGLSSPLFHVLHHGGAKPEWLFYLLCENGAPIHEHEVDEAFLRWCELPRLWMTNKYNAWWQHQGQEDKTFLKWCEHPYNVWWWQHVKHISRDTATQAYRAAFKHKDRKLYDILTHLPLPAPFDGLLVRVVFEAKQLWSWRIVVQREYEDDFLATWFNEGENMIHLTVRKYHAHSCYSAADAILDVLHLRDKGVNMSSPNRHGQTPLHLLLKLGTRKRRKDGFLELVALLKGNIGVQGVLETTTLELRKMTLF